MSVPAENIDQEKERGELRLNRDIEGFLLTAEMLEIDFDFAFAELNRYLQDVLMLSNGFSFDDLGVRERRKESLPRLIIPSESAYKFVDRWEVQNVDDTPPGSIALLKLTGVMRTQSGLSSPGADRLAADFRNAFHNENVKGIILETLSGGGESMAGTLIKSAISERNKPVVGFSHLGASAAYRVLSGTDEIIASTEQSEFGSIGTMLTLDTKILNKYRERFTDIYGTQVPKKNAEFRAAIAGDFTGLQERVNKLTGQFHDEIKGSRPLRGDAAFIKETLSGAVFDAKESKRRGLVDAIGNLQFAVKRVNALTKNY
jgi:protease-4